MTLKTIAVNLGERSYSIQVGPGLLSQAGRLFEDLPLGRKVLVVTNRTVGRLYGELLREALAATGVQVSLAHVPDSERAKSLRYLGRLYGEAVAAGLDRRCPILALGGGVVGDLAGFAAATYLRGVPFIQVPTTLLAQVDSSVGGKVAINLPQGKNLAGAFYQPVAVLADMSVLATLPRGELLSGLAEAIKHGAIADPEYLDFLDRERDSILGRSAEALSVVVAGSCRIKAGVVENDERESGERMHLNFGHTVGHALEAAAGYGAFRHGEAVAIGMVAAAEISVRLGYLDQDRAARLSGTISTYGLPTGLPGIDSHLILERLAYDKKIEESHTRFVLLRDFGRPFTTPAVPLGLVEEVLKAMGAR